MGLRETMNNNPAAVTGAAVVILLLALIYVFFRGGFFGGGGGDTGTAQIIYFDVSNKTLKLVPYDVKQYPNSPLDGSPETYEATLFACGECPEADIVDGMSLADIQAKGMYVGWLEKRDPNSDKDPSFNPSVQYRPFKGGKWIPGSSEAWWPIEDKLQKQCPGNAYAQQCFPAPLK